MYGNNPAENQSKAREDVRDIVKEIDHYLIIILAAVCFFAVLISL